MRRKRGKQQTNRGLRLRSAGTWRQRSAVLSRHWWSPFICKCTWNSTSSPAHLMIINQPFQSKRSQLDCYGSSSRFAKHKPNQPITSALLLDAPPLHHEVLLATNHQHSLNISSLPLYVLKPDQVELKKSEKVFVQLGDTRNLLKEKGEVNKICPVAWLGLESWWTHQATRRSQQVTRHPTPIKVTSNLTSLYK